MWESWDIKNASWRPGASMEKAKLFSDVDVLI
jgi:hypothetical protein